MLAFGTEMVSLLSMIRAAYAATLSVVETCRRRKLDPWSYIADTLARARQGINHQPIPKAV